MKKTIISSIALANLAFGISNEEIIKFYKSFVTEGVNVTVQSREKLKEYPDYESVVINISDGKNSESEIVFSNKDLLFQDIFDLKNKKSFKSEILENIMIKNISNIYKNEDSKNIISIGDDPKKPTSVIFSDPECPYCRAELKQTEKRLQTENIKMILTPVHDKTALEKSYLAYQEIKNAKSDSEKIKILRKYYDENFKVPQNSVTDAQVEQMEALRAKYFSAGIKGVPKIIDESKLK